MAARVMSSPEGMRPATSGSRRDAHCASARSCRILSLLLILLCLCPLALAEAPSAQQLQPVDELLQGEGIRFDALGTVQRLLSGQSIDWDAIQGAAQSSLRGVFSRAGKLFALLLVPALLLAIVQQLISDKGNGAAAGYVCYLTAALALMGAFHESAGAALKLIETVGDWITRLFPILTALLVSCGATASAAAYGPLLTLGAGLISSVIQGAALAMCGSAAAIAVMGSLSDRFSLGKLLDLLKDALIWVVGLSLTGFLGLVSLQSLLSASQDSAALRAAKYAVGGLIPGVGGEVADTMNAVSGSALLVKNATGVTGLIALLLVCMGPLIELAAALIALKLCAALTEPLGSSPLQTLVSRFSDVFTMLLVAAVATVVVGITLVGAVLATGGAALTG